MTLTGKAITGSVLALIGLYVLAFFSSRNRIKTGVRCADMLDLPEKGKTLGTFTQLQAAALAREAKDAFDRWLSSGSTSDAVAGRLMQLTNDQLYAVQYLYDQTYDTPLIDEITNDFAYYGLDSLAGGPASQLVTRLRTLKTGVK
ncbi:hypothetical protein ACAW74_18170 [Fibrella sp. WM1]|uniref:hypothetical protein n=1 Tax=Fibrella musci TaxID=3242485 RepID=UPI0035226C0B